MGVPGDGRREETPKLLRKTGTDMHDRTRNPIGSGSGPCLADRDVVEVPLLLPGWQVAALATAAQDRGLTAGEMLRCLLRDFIQGLEERQSPPVHWGDRAL
jgi:hypothetical protein